MKINLLIGIAILQRNFLIAFTQQEYKVTDVNDPEDNSNSSSGEIPKNVQEGNMLQTSFLIFISSSFLTVATSSVFGISMDNLSPHSPQNPFISGTAGLVDADPLSLLKTSIQNSFIDEVSNHQNFISTPLVVVVPTSYLLNSSYLLKSYNLLESSFYLLGSLSSHTSDINEYQFISSSSVNQSINLYSSYVYRSLPESGLEEIHSTVFSENIKQTPTAESRILTMTTSSSQFLEFERKGIQSSSAYDSRLQDENIMDSYSIKDENSNFKENKPTLSLSEKVSTDFSNFFIETRITPTVSRFGEDSTGELSALSSQAVFQDEIPTLKKSASPLMSHSIFTNLVEEINDLNKSYSHEIITDDTSVNNKTSRNEDAEIDEIISGIIHLLAGNVQVVRPTNQGFGIKPTRLHVPLQPSLVSTRINDRGPIRPNSFSRTVVVFSQPPNKGHPTELPLPGHFVPSTLQNPQFIRIRPTKVGEQPPTAVSVIHFYKQGPKPPNNPPSPQIPFRGEVFNSNLKPNGNVRIPTLSNEHVRPSFLNPDKQNVYNANSGNKYPHFIFTDQAASSVVVIHPSKPPLTETFEKFAPNQQKKENSNNKNPPSQKFEVLIDDTVKKKIFVSQTDNLSSNIHNTLNLKEASHNQKPSETNISPTREKDIVPHGPVTDWVPFAERPSTRDRMNQTSSLTDDTDVSIIMHPIIFDVTVSNSVQDVINSKNSTFNPNLSTPALIEAKTSISNQSRVALETTDYTELSSSVISTEYLQSNNLFTPDTSTSNNLSDISLKTNDIYSTPTTNVDFRDSQTTIISSNLDLRSSDNYRIRSSFTEKRAFVSATKQSISTSVPKTTETTLSSAKTLLGRPIVIPVDIEEVRPFAGPINPPGRENSSHGSTSENSVRRTTSSTTRTPIIRSQGRPRPNTIRIDTCIVGDDSTCDVSFNETCKTEMGISSCHCRPGYARSYTRGPCIPIVSLMLSMKVDRLGNKKVTFSPKYMDKSSDDYRVMEFEAKLALTSLISQIPAFSRTFQGMRVNRFYPIGEKLVINSTIFLEEKESTRTQAVRLRLRQLIGEAIRNRQQNIGESRLFVDGSFSPVTAIEDVNECSDRSLNDCSEEGTCFNVFGTYLCKCRTGYVDPFVHDERKSGRKCSACSPEYCSFHGKCFVEREKRLCKCHGNYIGSRCEIDGEVLGVALGASLAAIIIILLTLGCLCIWNRKWKQQQQKAEVLSSRSYNSNQTFSYMGNVMNGSTNPYHLTMEDRMRWAQISDVIKNISVQPNPDLPYIPPTTSALDQGGYSNRCPPSDEEISWYECRTRPRSRAMLPYGGMSGPSCFEMDISSRGGPYGGTSYHNSKRHKHSATRY